MGRDMEVVLPNDSHQMVQLSSLCNHDTIAELKIIFESQFGIPTRLQEIYAAKRGDDDTRLQSCVRLDGIGDRVIHIRVPVCWHRFVTGILNNDVENVYRRVQFPMQHISKGERLFVALFMSCCRGQSSMVSRLMNLDIEVDMRTKTESNRTLLHACALSGDNKCLEISIKHLLTSCFDCLESLDVNRESALKIAKRLGHQSIVKMLSTYASIKEDEGVSPRSSTESGIGLSDDSHSTLHQTQTSSPRHVNNSRDGNEKVLTKGKQNHLTKENRAIKDNDTMATNYNIVLLEEVCNSEETFPAPLTRQKSSRGSGGQLVSIMSDDGQIADRTIGSLSSSSDESENVQCCAVSSNLNRPQYLSMTPLLGRRREQDSEATPASPFGRSRRVGQHIVPNIDVFSDESSGEEDRLPSLVEVTSLTGHTNVKRSSSFEKGVRPANRVTVSTPCSPVTTPRHSPVEENACSLGIKDILSSKSAPNSPMTNRINLATGGALAARTRAPAPPPNSPISRASRRRQSEPFAPAAFSGGNFAARMSRMRKNSLAFQRSDTSRLNITEQRHNSRSNCATSIADPLRGTTPIKAMESEEERLDRPWNAWIVAKRQEPNSLASQPEERLAVPAASPGGRRRSFQQWLTNKDMNEMRQLHAEAQKAAQTAGKQVKGKSFEEWLEDKHRESQREKEKEKEKEEEQKGHVEKKQHRRRMSQAKYQSWLQEKELKALEEEEKRLGQAKEKLEKMRAKWEEEDEMKKEQAQNWKTAVVRTQSCPTNEPSDISRRRFSSLQLKSK